MRHRFGNAKLKRDVGSRNSLFKNLTTSVIEAERVITTVPKAKAVQPLVEKMITLAKRDTLHTRRQAASFLTTPKSVQKLQFPMSLLASGHPRSRRRRSPAGR